MNSIPNILVPNISNSNSGNISINNSFNINANVVTMVKSYILKHRTEDVRLLALKTDKSFEKQVQEEQEEINSSDLAQLRTFILQQIAGWQIARKKIPSWAESTDLFYPVHLSMEQCSSEPTARYKAEVIAKTNATTNETSDSLSFCDLTGGLGVDFSFIARKFNNATFIERNEPLCELAKHNFPVLGLKNHEIIPAEYNESLFYKTLSHRRFSVIYLDPARRDKDGNKVFSISDCAPDLLTCKEQLFQITDTIWVKYSPMLDLSLAIEELKNVKEVHIVALNNECKELLFCLKKNTVGMATDEVKLTCVNLNYKEFNYKEFNYDVSDSEEDHGNGHFTFSRKEERDAPLKLATTLKQYLYEPNVALLKAGAFKLPAQRFGVEKLSLNSHLYTSDIVLPDFPGKCFKIDGSLSLSKQDLKELLKNTPCANIVVRNFPLTVEQLKKKLKIKEGGATTLFATTLGEKKIIVITHRHE